MKFTRFILLFAILIAIVYLLGPSPDTPVYDQQFPELNLTGVELKKMVDSSEGSRKVKPDNEARIIWDNDSLKNKTEWAVVYLHGFSASQMEGDPVHRNFAAGIGANLYLTRMAEHGLDTTEVLLNLTPDKYWESAKKALAIGQALGEKVILMGTSTGGTNALQLAAAYPDKVNALILMSPNIAINDDNAWLLNDRWGLQVARLVKGSDYMQSSDQREVYKKYWYSKYRIEGAVALEEMIESSMTDETFEKVTQPLLLLYYYKDEQNQDPVVRVDAMKEMFGKISTPADKKREVPVPGAGDHVIGSPLKSKDVQTVQKEVFRFAREILKIQTPE